MARFSGSRGRIPLVATPHILPSQPRAILPGRYPSGLCPRVIGGTPTVLPYSAMKLSTNVTRALSAQANKFILRRPLNRDSACHGVLRRVGAIGTDWRMHKVKVGSSPHLR